MGWFDKLTPSGDEWFETEVAKILLLMLRVTMILFSQKIEIL